MKKASTAAETRKKAKIEATAQKNAEVESAQIRAHFDDERAKTIVAQKNVSDSHNTYSRRAACAHKTFTCATSWPLASIVCQEQAMQGSKE